MRTFLLTLLLVPILMAAGIYGLFAIWGGGLPEPAGTDELRPSARSVVLDREGRPIGSFAIENRDPIPLGRVPPIVVEAVLAAEDGRFYGHWGVNLIAFVRAAIRNLRAGGVEQGASTITMQLARNLFLDQSRTLERKLKEIVLAIRLERSFSKDEILELYLNRIYFGEGAYGVQAASMRFFGKNLSELSIAEAATLAGLPANPAAFSPVRHPEAAEGRRNRVLRLMRTQEKITEKVYNAALGESLVVRSSGSSVGEAPYFLEYVRIQLASRLGSDRVYEGGLTVRTTLDLELQRAAEQAVERHCREIEEDHLYRETFESFREGKRSAEGSTPYLQAALIAVEPQTGRILAMVGGRSYQDSRFNRAVQARRQPGSAFKPFIYALALKSGMTPYSVVVDEPVSYPMGYRASMGVWSPKNFGNKYSGPVTLRTALAKSINIPSVKLLERVGPRTAVDFARACGIQGEIPPYLSLALGTAEVTPLEIASAYGAWINEGMLVSPISILSVEDPLGSSIEDNRPATREVLDERTSGLLVGMLRAVVDNGTAAPARSKMGFTAPAAGKTGTTDDYTDAWFIGAIPRCVCAVWVGFDEKRTIGSGMTGAKAALPIWVDFMKEAVRHNGEEPFSVPAGVVEVKICPDSGMLATEYCRAVVDRFSAGSEPKSYCTIHGPALPQAPAEEEPEVDESW